MRCTILLCLLLLPAWAQTSPNGQPGGESRSPRPSGSASGRILDAYTGEPVAGARVMAFNLRARGPMVAGRSNADGRFSLAGLPPGPQYVQAIHPNYPGLLGLPQIGVYFEVQPDRETTDVAVKLLPAGVVSGRLRDDSGEPIFNCVVILTQAQMGSSPPQVIASGTTDDRGEFRLAPIPPDRYVLSTECTARVPEEYLLDVVGPYGMEPREAWPRVYYPGSRSPTGPAGFGVAPGAEHKIEFRLKPQRVTSLKGVLTAAPGVTGGAPPRIYLVPSGQEGDPTNFKVAGFDPVNRSFYFQSVPPGNYVLKSSAQGAHYKSASFVNLHVDISNAPPPPVTLQLRSTVVVQGKVEGPYPQPAGGPLNSRASVILRPAELSEYDYPLIGTIDPRDGSFQIAGVTPGRWTIGYYSSFGLTWIEAMQFGGAVFEGRTIEVTADSSAELHLSISSKFPTAQLELEAGAGTSSTYWTIQALPLRRSAREGPVQAGSGFAGEKLRWGFLPPGQYYLSGVPQSYSGEMINERLAGLMSRELQPVEIPATGGKTVSVRCFTYEDIRRIALAYITGEAQPSAPAESP